MSLSSDIARANTERLAGRKGSGNLPARLVPRNLALLSNTTDQFVKPRREIRHDLPAPEEKTHHRVTDAKRGKAGNGTRRFFEKTKLKRALKSLLRQTQTGDNGR
jgi:hypothetical protein